MLSVSKMNASMYTEKDKRGTWCGTSRKGFTAEEVAEAGAEQ